MPGRPRKSRKPSPQNPNPGVGINATFRADAYANNGVNIDFDAVVDADLKGEPYRRYAIVELRGLNVLSESESGTRKPKVRIKRIELLEGDEADAAALRLVQINEKRLNRQGPIPGLDPVAGLTPPCEQCKSPDTELVSADADGRVIVCNTCQCRFEVAP